MKKILIVEDEIIIAQNMKEILEANGYHVTGICPTIMKASFQFFNDQPDLVLLDIKLKGKGSGIDFANEINEKYHVPTIFITANTDNGTLEEALRTNPYGYLSKPIQEKDLLLNVDLTLNRFLNETKTREEQSSLLEKAQLFNMGEFVSGLLHDIMVPLEEIKNNIADNPKLKSDVLPRLNSAIDVINNFKEITKKQDDQQTVIQLSEILKTSISIINYSIVKNKIKITLPDDDFPITCFKNQTIQMFTNLLKNSIDAIKDIDEERWIKIYSEENDDYVIIDILDSGDGIPDEVAAKMFEPLFSSKIGSEATGFGLYTSAKAMERIGGQLEYIKDKRTHFQIKFKK